MIKHSSFLYTSDLENVVTLCFRAFENSNYEVRCSVAKLLGLLIASTQIQNKEHHSGMIIKLFWGGRVENYYGFTTILKIICRVPFFYNC